LLGRKHPPVVRLLTIVAAVFLVAALPAVGDPDRTESVTALRLENAQLAAKTRSAELALFSLDSQLAAARARRSSVQGQLAALRSERAVLMHELQIARAGQRISQHRLASRLRQLYDQGELSAIEVVFEAKSITDAITQLDNVHRVATLNHDVLAQLRTAQIRLQTTSQKLAARTADLSAAIRRATATETALRQARAARASYIGSLSSRQNLNAAQIVRLESKARVARARSQQLSSAAPAAPIAALIAPGAQTAATGFSDNRTLTVTISGYALPGTTATGLPVGWGVAAVDPRVIPLGTHIWVPGYGQAVAADTGGAIVGTRVDLWFPTLGQARAWGLQTVTISVR
jgi:3D (Asp-Asp-Asp) domain-containing protein